MLKIKDNVDLTELKKFGFEYSDELGIGMYVKTSEHHKEEYEYAIFEEILLFEDDRKLVESCNLQTTMDYDTLFDLIQAGLVEKVNGEE